jgi:hypothetical protein
MKEDKTYFFNKVLNCNLQLIMLPTLLILVVSTDDLYRSAGICLSLLKFLKKVTKIQNYPFSLESKEFSNNK